MKNLRRGMFHRSEEYAKEYAAAEERGSQAIALPTDTDEERRLRKKELLEASRPPPSSVTRLCIRMGGATLSTFLDAW